MVDFLIQVLTMSSPLILVAMAGYASERAGIVNIGLEGKMLIGCFVCAACAPKFGMVGSLFFAMIASTALSLIHWVLTQTYRMDHIISGMAINFLAVGSTGFMKFTFGKDTMPSDKTLPLWIFYALALFSPLVFAWMSSKTKFGLRHRSVGSDPDKARLLGIEPAKIRFLALVLTGICCGVAGALLVSETRQFTDGMTSGRGYIALAALILGGWRPIPASLACLLFGCATAVNIRLNGSEIKGIVIPSEIWKMLPYFITLLALAGFLGRNKTPAGLGKN
jgi:general nucleoside transport system permease protein